MLLQHNVDGAVSRQEPEHLRRSERDDMSEKHARREESEERRRTANEQGRRVEAVDVTLRSEGLGVNKNICLAFRC